MTGFVAATGQSYLCPDTANDPLYLEGADGARSSLTVPLIDHGTVIGTLNVENAQPDAFDERDRQFLEIYAPQRGLGAEHARAAPGREVQRGHRVGRGDQPRAGPAARRHPERRHDGARPLRRPRRGHHRPAPAPDLPGPRDPQPDPEGRLDDHRRPEARGLAPAPRRWPRPACWWSTPTRRSGGRPTTCSAARGRPSRRPATPTRRSRWRGRRPTPPPWSISASPTSTGSRPSGGSARSQPERADHPDDGVRLRPLALDRQGAAAGAPDRPLQALPRRPPDRGRPAGAPLPLGREGAANPPPAPPEDKPSGQESPAIEAPVHES